MSDGPQRTDSNYLDGFTSRVIEAGIDDPEFMIILTYLSIRFDDTNTFKSEITILKAIYNSEVQGAREKFISTLRMFASKTDPRQVQIEINQFIRDVGLDSSSIHSDSNVSSSKDFQKLEEVKSGASSKISKWLILIPGLPGKISKFIKPEMLLAFKDPAVIAQYLKYMNWAGYVLTGLAIASLVFSAAYDIWRWWKGKITGKRLINNLLKTAGIAAGGVAGGLAGAYVGGCIYPVVGVPVGSVIGGVAGTFAANIACEKFGLWLFNLPKEEAVEKAYNILGVNKDTKADIINIKFKELCEIHKKNQEEWQKLQYAFQIIKVARGEKYYENNQ